MAKRKQRKSGFKKLKCKLCTSTVDRVDISTRSVLCWKCTHLTNDGYTIQEVIEMDKKQYDNIFVS